MSKLRYPAVPLITVDPFFSIWSMNDKLTDDTTRHWTGSRMNMIGLIKYDEKTYRFMGVLNPDNLFNKDFAVLPQKDVIVKPMSSVYTFENDDIELNVEFMTPLVCSDLKLLARPVSYISYEVKSKDGVEREYEVYIGISSEAAVNIDSEEVEVKAYENGICVGRGEKDILATSGDNHRINWGWLHIFADKGFEASCMNRSELAQKHRFDWWCYIDYFRKEEKKENFFSVRDTFAYIGLSKKYEGNSFSDYICLGYDDIHSIRYFGRQIDAYYKKDGDAFSDIQKKAISEYKDIKELVLKEEEKLLEAAGKISGKYKDIVSLAYRQAIAAHKLTWDGEEIQFLSKECFSNGCIGTLDVTYPSIPLFLYYNPELVEGMLNPIFKFARSERWRRDYAPHDVGRYPIADGQVYGFNPDGSEREGNQMPVEECGNAILCVYAICHQKNDFSYAEKNLDLIEKWAEYLKDYGVDPENQLCTDDFAGHLAHNSNLSLKAIMGICAFSEIAKKLGFADKSREYKDTAKQLAKIWKEKAKGEKCYKLAFDREGTWSMKYNMVWDKIYGWDIFDADIFEDEVSYYKTVINKYGLPLDNRSDYTKSDWQMWTTRLTNDKEYRNMIIDAMWDFLNETEDRVPFTDWYFTSEPNQRGFQNRTVQGGLFIPLI